jgi:drug/metabolite transporter (DMT)-like permease
MKLRSVFYLVLNATLIATGHILQKAVLNYGVDRLVFAFVRIATGFFLITLLLLFQKYNPIKVVRRNARHFVVLGVFFSGVGILLKLWGLSHTSATNASFIMSLSSVTAVIFAYFLLNEKAHRSFYAIVAFMIVGVYLVSTKGESLIPQKGDLIILGLVFLIGFMQVYGKKVLKTLTVLETSFGRALFGMVFLGLMIPIMAPDSFSTIPNVKVLLLVMANGLTFSGSIMAFYKALQAEGASNSAMFALLVPVFTAVMGRLVLGETFTLVQIAGGAIILAGSMTIAKIKVRQPVIHQ